MLLMQLIWKDSLLLSLSNHRPQDTDDLCMLNMIDLLDEKNQTMLTPITIVRIICKCPSFHYQEGMNINIDELKTKIQDFISSGDEEFLYLKNHYIQLPENIKSIV